MKLKELLSESNYSYEELESNVFATINDDEDALKAAIDFVNNHMSSDIAELIYEITGTDKISTLDELEKLLIETDIAEALMQELMDLPEFKAYWTE